MNILLCGATGFIGKHLDEALTTAGHRVFRAVRRPSRETDIKADFQHDVTPEQWLPRLRSMDAVINTVGILGESKKVTFSALHRDALTALFDACVIAGVKRVVQISALGGTSDRALTPYMRTKREADAHLMKLNLDWIILRPSLVVGTDGASSQFFRMLASLPMVGLPGKGDQTLQPVHIEHVCEAVVRALEEQTITRQIIDVVGPNPMTYREMLATYRDAMGLKSPLWLSIPMPVMHVAASMAAKLPQRVFTSDTLIMLDEGNTANPARLTQLIGHPPAAADAWFARLPPGMLRAEALWHWQAPLFRIVLALVWIVTGILSLGVYPVASSLELLSLVGLHGTLAMAALYGSAIIDIAFGVLSLLFPSRALWRLQIGLIAAYTVVITLFLPQWWLHPFGPILKNIPILAILIALDAAERKSA